LLAHVAHVKVLARLLELALRQLEALLCDCPLQRHQLRFAARARDRLRARGLANAGLLIAELLRGARLLHAGGLPRRRRLGTAGPQLQVPARQLRRSLLQLLQSLRVIALHLLSKLLHFIALGSRRSKFGDCNFFLIAKRKTGRNRLVDIDCLRANLGLHGASWPGLTRLLGIDGRILRNSANGRRCRHGQRQSDLLQHDLLLGTNERDVKVGRIGVSSRLRRSRDN
jgi:hypothetical protein